MQNTLAALVLFAFLLSCSTARKPTGADVDLMRLKGFMTGHFNSAAQAAQDSSFFDITLHMIPIWPNRPGHWLYVEQAVSANQAKPYRQRIYRLEQLPDGRFQSSVYTLQKEKEFVLAWQTPEKFDALTTADLELKAGCEVVLVKKGDVFEGATGERSCPSELRGAAYATSKVQVFPDRIVSWDQGFDASGNQVWGATKGGYSFVKYTLPEK